MAQANVVVLKTIFIMFVENLNPHYGDRQLKRNNFNLPMIVAQNVCKIFAYPSSICVSLQGNCIGF